MNKPRFTQTLLLSLMIGAVPLAANAAETKAEADANAAPVAASTSDAQYWYNFGWLVSQGIVALEMNADERAEFMKGVEGGLTGQPGPGEDMAMQQQLNSFLENRYMKVSNEKNAAFMAELSKNPNVKKTDSGLLYEVVKPGNDVRAATGDSVRVHYRGALTDGVVFDSSFERGEPATFLVEQVVPGFGEGVGLVGEGGEVKLYIPGNLAYGDNPPMGSGIPPNATLVFDVSVEAVNPPQQ